MKIGDVVKLKSGGVRMTVNDMYDGVVYCNGLIVMEMFVSIISALRL